jgi:hypothetical protein
LNSKDLKDFPILTDELELSDRIVLQKRLSQCGSKGALTIKLMEKLLRNDRQQLPLLVVWFGFLDSPNTRFADCVLHVKSSLATRGIELFEDLRTLAEFRLLRDSIVTEGSEEIQSMIRVRSAMLEKFNLAKITSARMLIEQSRTVVSRHRQLMQSAEEQIRGCEERLVWNRLKVSLLRDQSPNVGTSSIDQEITAIFEKRMMIGEERRVIREADLAVAESAEKLQ